MFLIHFQETRRVENVFGRVSLGGEKHRTDKRGATERALERRHQLHLCRQNFEALQSDTSGCDLVFESISGVVTL